jgi:transcriptional regulator with XRE-family HTH domain
MASQLLTYLHDLHETRGLSLRETAALADLDHSYVSLILQGQRSPSRDTLISLGIAWHLDLCEIDDLLIQAGYPPLGRSARREYRAGITNGTARHVTAG